MFFFLTDGIVKHICESRRRTNFPIMDYKLKSTCWFGQCCHIRSNNILENSYQKLHIILLKFHSVSAMQRHSHSHLTPFSFGQSSFAYILAKFRSPSSWLHSIKCFHHTYPHEQARDRYRVKEKAFAIVSPDCLSVELCILSCQLCVY